MCEILGSFYIYILYSLYIEIKRGREKEKREEEEKEKEEEEKEKEEEEDLSQVLGNPYSMKSHKYPLHPHSVSHRLPPSASCRFTPSGFLSALFVIHFSKSFNKSQLLPSQKNPLALLYLILLFHSQKICYF